MKPNVHLKARSQNGLVTVQGNLDKLCVLGASCFTSAKDHDGPIGSFTIKPTRKQEVVAIAIFRDFPGHHNDDYVLEVFLLSVTLAENTANIDLEFPFVPSSPDRIPQLIHDRKSCTMRITVTGESVTGNGEFPIISTISIPRETKLNLSFDPLCQFLVDSTMDVPDLVKATETTSK